MYAAKRPFLRPTIYLFIIASILLAACGTRGDNSNWPGLSTDGKNVYVAYGPGVLAYDVETQDQIWSYPAESSPTLLFYAAPSVQDGRIILGDYGASGGTFSPKKITTIYALKSNGVPTELWSKPGLATGSIVAPPLQVGDQIFIGTADNSILALDETGKPLWPEPFETGHSIWGQPAYKNGVLYVASLDKTVYAIDAGTGQEKWNKVLGGALASAPIVNFNLVYIASFDGQLHALDINSGDEKWAVTAEDWIWSAPAYSEGVVYFADIKGNVYAVDGETGEQIWTQQIEKPIQTSPVVAGDAIYIASEGDSELEQGMLTALLVEDGGQIWQQSTPAPLYTTPVIVDDLIIVALQNESALLIAFDLESGGQQWIVPPPEQ